MDQFKAALPARICAPTIIDKGSYVSYKMTIASVFMTVWSIKLSQGANPVRMSLNELVNIAPNPIAIVSSADRTRGSSWARMRRR